MSNKSHTIEVADEIIAIGEIFNTRFESGIDNWMEAYTFFAPYLKDLESKLAKCRDCDPTLDLLLYFYCKQANEIISKANETNNGIIADDVIEYMFHQYTNIVKYARTIK